MRYLRLRKVKQFGEAHKLTYWTDESPDVSDKGALAISSIASLILLMCLISFAPLLFLGLPR